MRYYSVGSYIWNLLLVLVFVGCVSVPVELKSGHKTDTSFTYYSHYGLFGLIGVDSLNIKTACMEGQPIYIKHYFSFEDLLFAITTVGIYTPKSLQIRCSAPILEPKP